MNHTPNFQRPDWEEKDRIQMGDFNDMTAKIDTALAAERDARQLRRQLEQWLRQVRQAYDGLCSDVESTVAHAASELGRAGASLDQLLQLMGGQEEAFDGLSQICSETTFGRPEPPMPIDEK